MKKKVLSIALFLTITGSASAQSNVFAGFTAGLNISSIGSTTTLQGPDSKGNLGQQSAVPGVELGYHFAATPSVILGLTATYDFANTKLGSISAFDGSTTLKGQNRTSINFKPGFLVSQNSMIYAIVGYNAMSTKIDANSTTAPSENLSKNLNGIGYGAGIATMIDKNIFVKAEVQQVNFNSWNFDDGASSVKPNLTIGTIGVGYKF